MTAPMIFPGQESDPSDHGALGWDSPGWNRIYTGTSPDDNLTPELPGAVPQNPRYDSDIPSPYALLRDAAEAGQILDYSDMA